MKGVILERGGGLPVARIRWVVPSGAVQDSRLKEGITSCAWQSTSRGGARWSRLEQARRLGRVCRGFHLKPQEFEVEMSADVPLSKIPDFAGQWSSMIHDSLPTPGEFKKLIGDMEGEIRLDFEQPEVRAESLCRRLLYGESPFGNMCGASLRSLKSFQVEEVVARARQLHGLQGWLGVSGDVPDADVETLMAALGSRGGAESSVTLPPSVILPGRRLGLWHDPLQHQASCCIQWSTGPHHRKDLMDQRLAEMILTSEFSSMLSMEFRQKSGLTYGIHGSHRMSPAGGVFQVRFSTESSMGPRMLAQVLGALEAFAGKRDSFDITDMSGHCRRVSVEWPGPSFEDCRTKAIHALPFLVATEADRVSRRLEEALLGTWGVDNASREEFLRKATPDSVSGAARWLFEAHHLSVAVVDNMAERREDYVGLEQWSVVEEDVLKLCGLT